MAVSRETGDMVEAVEIVVADSFPVVRGGLRGIFLDQPGLRVVGEASRIPELMRTIAVTSPDVVVVDSELLMDDGFGPCKALGKLHPDVRLVVLAGRSAENQMMGAFAAGAGAFLTKESAPSVLQAAVRVVARGGTFVDPFLAPRLISIALTGRELTRPRDLTRRELTVLAQFPKGLRNREIARSLGIGEETVKSHVKSILRKVAAKDRAQAATWAVREGIV